VIRFKSPTFIRIGFMVFNATFNNISVTSWRSFIREGDGCLLSKIVRSNWRNVQSVIKFSLSTLQPNILKTYICTVYITMKKGAKIFVSLLTSLPNWTKILSSKKCNIWMISMKVILISTN